MCGATVSAEPLVWFQLSTRTGLRSRKRNWIAVGISMCTASTCRVTNASASEAQLRNNTGLAALTTPG